MNCIISIHENKDQYIFLLKRIKCVYILIIILLKTNFSIMNKKYDKLVKFKKIEDFLNCKIKIAMI